MAHFVGESEVGKTGVGEMAPNRVMGACVTKRGVYMWCGVWRGACVCVTK